MYGADYNNEGIVEPCLRGFRTRIPSESLPPPNKDKWIDDLKKEIRYSRGPHYIPPERLKEAQELAKKMGVEAEFRPLVVDECVSRHCRKRKKNRETFSD